MAKFFSPSRVPKLVVLPMHSLSVLSGIMYRLSVIVHYSAYTRCMSLIPLDVVIYILWALRINVFFYCILPVKNLFFSICYSTINLKVRSEAASCVTFPKYSTHGSSCLCFLRSLFLRRSCCNLDPLRRWVMVLQSFSSPCVIAM